MEDKKEEPKIELPCDHKNKWKRNGTAGRGFQTDKRTPAFVSSIYCKECGEVKIIKV